MSDFDSPGMTLESPARRRPTASRFSELGDRIARTFGTLERPRSDAPAWTPGEPEDWNGTEVPAWEQVEPPFPIVRHGYQTSTVDDYVAELERELEELRSRTPDERAISEEINRIGEQTAAILQVAHEKASEVTREAQVQADRCMADAAANALAITERASRRLRELDVETDSVWHERARLIEDVRSVAGALATLAQDAAERYPAESERSETSVPPPDPDAPAGVDAPTTQFPAVD